MTSVSFNKSLSFLSNNDLVKLSLEESRISQVLASLGLSFEQSESGYMEEVRILDSHKGSMASMYFYTDANGAIVLNTLSVSDKHKREGLGTFLMVYLVCKAIEQSVKTIEIDSVTEEGAHFYAYFGFIPSDSTYSDQQLLKSVSERSAMIFKHFNLINGFMIGPRDSTIALHVNQPVVLEKVYGIFETAVGKALMSRALAS